MTQHAFKFSKCVEGFPEPAEDHEWDFLEVEKGLKGSGPKYEFLKKRLQASNSRAFRIWKLSPLLKLVSLVLGIGVVVLAVWAWFNWASATIAIPPVTVWSLGLFVAVVAAVVFFVVFVLKKLGIVRLTETLVNPLCSLMCLCGPLFL